MATNNKNAFLGYQTEYHLLVVKSVENFCTAMQFHKVINSPFCFVVIFTKTLVKSLKCPKVS